MTLENPEYATHPSAKTQHVCQATKYQLSDEVYVVHYKHNETIEHEILMSNRPDNRPDRSKIQNVSTIIEALQETDNTESLTYHSP